MRLDPGNAAALEIEVGELESVVAGDYHGDYQDTLLLTITTD